MSYINEQKYHGAKSLASKPITVYSINTCIISWNIWIWLDSPNIIREWWNLVHICTIAYYIRVQSIIFTSLILWLQNCMEWTAVYRPIYIYIHYNEFKSLHLTHFSKYHQKLIKFGTYMLHSILHLCTKYHSSIFKTLASIQSTVEPLYCTLRCTAIFNLSTFIV